MAELSYTRLHDYHHDDYDVVKEHIFQQVGDLNQIRVFRRFVLCAVYIRPILNPRNGLSCTPKAQAEDVAQGKTMLIIKAGPEAFNDPEENRWAYGDDGAPKVGDWVFAGASTGTSLHVCMDGAKIVTYEDRHGETHPAYEAFEKGWPCRLLHDDSLIGALAAPHQVV